MVHRGQWYTVFILSKQGNKHRFYEQCVVELEFVRLATVL